MPRPLLTHEEMAKKSEELAEVKHNLINEFVKGQLNAFPKANETVLHFIADFNYHSVTFYDDLEQHCESIRVQYRAGYCYFFAMILKDAFGRGEICWAAPYSHIVWVDDDGIPYDIEGVNESECDYYIPISYLGEAIVGFKHVRGLEYIVTEEFINETIERYKRDLEIKHTSQTDFF